jgi:hypothetical protein
MKEEGRQGDEGTLQTEAEKRLAGTLASLRLNWV